MSDSSCSCYLPLSAAVLRSLRGMNCKVPEGNLQKRWKPTSPVKDTINTHSRSDLTCLVAAAHSSPLRCGKTVPTHTFLPPRTPQYLSRSRQFSTCTVAMNFLHISRQHSSSGHTTASADSGKKSATNKPASTGGWRSRAAAHRPSRRSWGGPQGPAAWAQLDLGRRKELVTHGDNRLQGPAGPFQITFLPYFVPLLFQNEDLYCIKDTETTVGLQG